MAEVVQLIHTFISRGTGKDHDPHRMVEQYWTFVGDLLWERDAWQDAENLTHTAIEVDGRGALTLDIENLAGEIASKMAAKGAFNLGDNDAFATWLASFNTPAIPRTDRHGTQISAICGCPNCSGQA